MRCPFCSFLDSQVKDSRPTDDGTSIRRRRYCPDCDSRFTTFEHVQIRELSVLKKNGDRKPFNRDKLVSSILISVRKRPVTEEQVEMMVNNIVRTLESSGESEIKSHAIGEAVMDALAKLDKVAYVRFASVYKDFRAAEDFEKFVDQISGETN